MNEEKRRKRAEKDAAYRAAQEKRSEYEAELDAKAGMSQGAGAAKRHTSNSRYDWRRGKVRGHQRRDTPVQSTESAPAASTRTPRPSAPGLLFGGRAKSLDEMRQQRRTDNGI